MVFEKVGAHGTARWGGAGVERRRGGGEEGRRGGGLARCLMMGLNSMFLIAFFSTWRRSEQTDCPNLLHFSHIDFWKSSSVVHHIFPLDTNNPYYCVWYCGQVSLPKYSKFSLCSFPCCWFLNDFLKLLVSNEFPWIPLLFARTADYNLCVSLCRHDQDALLSNQRPFTALYTNMQLIVTLWCSWPGALPDIFSFYLFTSPWRAQAQT